MSVMLARVCRSSWPQITRIRPVAVYCRLMCSDSDSTVISHRRTYLKRDAKLDVKPIAKQSDPLWTTMNSKDLLHETIQATETLNDLLTVIDRHHSAFRQKHVKAAFHMLKVLHKSEGETTTIPELPQFLLLCKATVKLIRTFHAKELLFIFARLVDFGVSPKALIFRSVVQMLRQDINGLHADSLLLLENILNHDIDKQHPADTDPTVGALRIAMPLVLEIRLTNNEFESNDMSILIPSLRVAIARHLSGDLVNKLMLLIRNQNEQLTFFQYLKLVSYLTSPAIAEFKDVDMHLAHELTSHCLEQFAKLVKTYEWTRTSDDAVVDMFQKSFEGRKTFYSKDFFDLVVEVQLRRGTETRHLVKLAKSMLPYGHVSRDLVNQIADNLAHEKLHTDFEADLSIGALHPLVVLSDFEPGCGWDQILHNLFDDDLMAEAAVRQTFQYLKILESMALIGKYNAAFYSNLSHALTTMTTRPVPLGTVGQRLLNVNLGLGHDDHGMPLEQVRGLQQQLQTFVQESIRVLNPIRKEFTESSSSLLRDSLVKALGEDCLLLSVINTYVIFKTRRRGFPALRDMVRKWSLSRLCRRHEER